MGQAGRGAVQRWGRGFPNMPGTPQAPAHNGETDPLDGGSDALILKGPWIP